MPHRNSWEVSVLYLERPRETLWAAWIGGEKIFLKTFIFPVKYFLFGSIYKV